MLRSCASGHVKRYTCERWLLIFTTRTGPLRPGYWAWAFSSKAETLTAFGRIPAGEMEWPRTFASVAPRRAFEGESLRLCLLIRRSKRARIVLAWAVGSDFGIHFSLFHETSSPSPPLRVAWRWLSLAIYSYPFGLGIHFFLFFWRTLSASLPRRSEV